MGSSSGGHQAALTAMRPRDSRYSSIPLSSEGSVVDARVNGAILLWPVIDPLGGYQHAKNLKASGKPYPTRPALPFHSRAWALAHRMP
jgi:acetyl esterase